MNRRELFEFCRHQIDDRLIVFDEILTVFDRVYDFLETHNLPLKYEKQIILIKLTEFVYKNSKL